MKLKILSSIVASAFIFFACNNDDITDNYLPSAEISSSVRSVTIFDAPFTCDFSVSNPGVASFTITGGAAEKEVTITDQKGSAQFTEADFGDAWEIDGGLDCMTTIDFGTNKATQEFSIAVVDALSASTEGTASEYDASKVYVDIAGETEFNNMEQVVVEWKVISADYSDPDFVELYSTSNVAKFEYMDSIVGADYSVTDTIVFKVTATSGANSESKQVEITVGTKDLTEAEQDMLSTSEAEFSFIPATDEDAAAGTLVFASTDTERGFSSADVVFVEITEMPEDFSELVTTVDEGTTSSTVDNVVIGDMFAFMFTDSEMEYYGTLTVTNVEAAITGAEENAIEFSYTMDVKE